MIAEKENCTITEFALRCARSFGVCIDMRELPFDTPVPERFELESHYQEDIDKAVAKYEAFMALSDEEKAAELERSYNEMVEDYANLEKEKNAKRRVLRQRYEVMLDKIKKWQPPTSEHVNLRDFMIRQVQESIESDCKEYIPRIGSREEWLDVNAHIDLLKRKIEMEKKFYKEALKHTEECNKWLSDLRESLKGLD